MTHCQSVFLRNLEEYKDSLDSFAAWLSEEIRSNCEPGPFLTVEGVWEARQARAELLQVCDRVHKIFTLSWKKFDTETKTEENKVG